MCIRDSAYPDVETAVAAAKEKANKNDFIFVGGSSFIVADLLTVGCADGW